MLGGTEAGHGLELAGAGDALGAHDARQSKEMCGMTDATVVKLVCHLTDTDAGVPRCP